MNPNNQTAKYYDIVSTHTKGEEVTNEELSLIKRMVPAGSKILDIGAGTGRHLIPLLLSGYEIAGVESSSVMVNELIQKAKFNNIKSEVSIYDSIWSIDEKNEQNDLIIMMWNSFNEIMTVDMNIGLFMEDLPELLNKYGKILINSDNPENIEMDKVEFSYEILHEDRKYYYSWEVINYDSRLKVTTSKESIKVTDVNDNQIDLVEAEIKQRWFSEAEYEKIFSDYGYKIERVNLKTNDELYLIITKQA